MEISENEQVLETLICPRCKSNISRDVTECPKCRTILNFDSSSIEERIEQFKTYSLTEILLKDREYLFEMINKNEALLSKMIYSAAYALIFTIIYGFVLGSHQGMKHGFIMGAKVPLVLFGALLITMPVFFTFNIFIGARLSFKQMATILLIGNYLSSMVLLSLSPIILLFVIFSDGSGFLYILNIVFLVISCGIGVALLWKAMEYFIIKNCYHGNSFVLTIWSVIYSFVVLQFAWSLKVFGDLSKIPIFKQLGIEGNFYMAIFKLVKTFMSGDD